MRRPTTEEMTGLRAILERVKRIDLDAKDREQSWCRSGCPGNDGYGRCNWYDLFDTPPDGPEILETSGPAAPELCPFRQPGRAVLVRAL